MMKTVKSYEHGGNFILLNDDAQWYYVVSPATWFYSRYSAFEDADDVWTEQILELEGRESLDE